MTPPAGVVFDLDGTLVLSEGRNAVVWRSFFEANGIRYDDELAHHVTGRRPQDSLVELMHLFPDRPMDELLGQVDDFELAVPLTDVQPVAGAVHLVRRLADAAMPLALVTSAGRRHAHGLLRELGLTDAFAATVTAGTWPAASPTRRATWPPARLSACHRGRSSASRIPGPGWPR
jgi:beta-phosphoglucomutase-like phosphatase (HAD superfamily)